MTDDLLRRDLAAFVGPFVGVGLGIGVVEAVAVSLLAGRHGTGYGSLAAAQLLGVAAMVVAAFVGPTVAGLVARDLDDGFGGRRYGTCAVGAATGHLVLMVVVAAAAATTAHVVVRGDLALLALLSTAGSAVAAPTSMALGTDDAP